MAARRFTPEPEREPEPAPTLRHNPFAALKKDGAGAISRLGNAQPIPGSEPKVVRSAKPDRHNAPPDRRIAKPAVHAAIVVRREKKGRGGKAVTLAEGADLAGRDLETLARELAKALGAGARVEDGALVVQGEQVDRLVAWLGGIGVSSG
jgi:translation initiation factor 1 (eIF-1/SUI1)